MRKKVVKHSKAFEVEQKIARRTAKIALAIVDVAIKSIKFQQQKEARAQIKKWVAAAFNVTNYYDYL